ncbi:MAG: stimulus-sensing domain-containing protein [Alphaproteobacteria bacterium]
MPRDDERSAAAGPPTIEEMPIRQHWRPRRLRAFRGLSARIIALNALGLVLLAGGVLYLGRYPESLVEAEIEALKIQAEVFAAAVGEGAVQVGVAGGYDLDPSATRDMLRRLVQPVEMRARVFGLEGELVADSRLLVGRGGFIRIEPLPTPGRSDNALARLIERLAEMVEWIPSVTGLPRYEEKAEATIADFPEVDYAMIGEAESALRVNSRGEILLFVAVPVQRYKQIAGVLLLSKSDAALRDRLGDVRTQILKISAATLAVMLLMSVLLAGTIARPIRRLAAAAMRVRLGGHREQTIPDFTARRDEIGDLSAALREMTAALWLRLDAIERFAADVAHEIRNPLTSLRSAVETVARIDDPARKKQLMDIILADVERLDRLITDISSASRLDAELSRAEMEPVDLARLLGGLVEAYRSIAKPAHPLPEIVLAVTEPLMVNGTPGRLGQTFRNLIDNAISFSPAGGTIRIRAASDGDWVRVVIEDDGPGIPPENLETIFRRFYSQRPSGEGFGSHSGLGLSIARQIIEVHGGRIHAENRAGPTGAVLGARFVVRLPKA